MLEWSHDNEHNHTILYISPSTKLNKYINAAKATSSRLIKKEFPSIKLKLWKEAFWTSGFYVSSTGSTQIEIVKNYILNQGEKEC
ncbi:MAG: IS200/IS605 family transposase [Streptococcus sp.]|nr:MAG: IS200/IS605 family transposase [Streptococcus sp.]